MNILSKEVIDAIKKHESTNPPCGFGVIVGSDCIVSDEAMLILNKPGVWMFQGHEIFFDPDTKGFVIENWELTGGKVAG